MKKITLLFLTLFMSYVGYSQLVENFDAGSALPVGWQRFANGTGVATSPRLWEVTQTNPNSAPNAMLSRIYAITTVANQVQRSEDWLVTKSFTVPASAQLQFNTRKQFPNDYDEGQRYQIWTAPGTSDPTNPASYTMKQEWNTEDLTDTPATYVQKTIDLSSFASGSQLYIAFVRVTIRTTHITNLQPGGWLIDDVEVASKCQPPTALSVKPGIGLRNADLYWTTPAGGGSTWDIVLIREDQQFSETLAQPLPATQTVVSFAVPYQVTGLQPGTDYKYYVRSVCSATNKSTWSAPSYFSTPSLGQTCADPIVIPIIPHSSVGNTFNSADRYDAGQGATALCGVTTATTNYTAGNDVFYTFTAPTAGSIRIKMTPNAANSGMFLYAGCTAPTAPNMGPCLAGVANNNATPRIINNFPVTAGQSFVILLSSSAATQTYGYTLEIQYVYCDPPVSLNAVPTRTDATLTWANPTTFTASSWEVAVQTAGAAIPTGAGFTVAPNPTVSAAAAFGGPLTEGTNYQFWVRANCGDGTFSRWEGPFTFFTPFCDAPNFCAHTFDLRGTAGWQGAVMHVKQNGAVVKILGPEFVSGTSLPVSVNLCTGIPFELVWVSPGTAPATVAITIKNSFGQTLLTKNGNTTDQPSTTPLFTEMVDCLFPKCLPPTNPRSLTGANAPTASTARLTWVPAAGTTNFEVAVRFPAEAAPDNAAPITPANVTPEFANYLVEGLLSDTQYVFYVRAICDNDKKSNWVLSTTFRTAISCSFPTTQGVVSTTQTSARLSWAQNAYPGTPTVFPSAWEVVVLPSTATAPLPTTSGRPFSIGDGTAVSNGLTPATYSVTYDGLAPGINYVYYVRAACSSTDFSRWIGPKAFSTLCAPLNVPLTETFNPTSTTSLCWKAVSLSGTNVWSLIDTATPFEGTQTASFTPNAGTANNDYLISPDLILPVATAGQYRMKFRYRVLNAASHADAANTIEVLLSTTGSDPSVAGTYSQTLMAPTTWSNTTYLEKVINLDAFAGSTVSIAWHIPNGTNNRNKIFVDQVIFELIPPCPDPTDLGVVIVTPTNAQLKWTKGFQETLWQVVVQPIGSGVPPTNYNGATTDNNLNYLATALQNGDPLASATDYQYYVRAYCSATSQSQWVGPFVFKTLCGAFDVPFFEGFNSTSARKFCWNVVNANSDTVSWNLNDTTNAYQGDQVASIQIGGRNGNNNDWLISPTVNLTGRQQLRFRYRVESATAASASNFEVLLSNGGTATTAFTTTVIPARTYNNATYLESVTSLGTATGLTNIAWHVPTNTINGSKIYIDNVYIEDVPNCPAPINLAVDCIGSDRANIKWTSGGTETSWEIAIVAAGQPIPAAGTRIFQNFHYATDLNPETQYEVFVRAVCPAAVGGGFGSWTMVGFKTVTRALIDAAPFCASATGGSIVFPNTSTADNIPALGAIACLASTPRPVWYYLQVDSPGDLFFEITQRTGRDASGNLTGQELDVDFAAWGPFTSMNQACDQISLVNCACPNNFPGNQNFYPFGNIVDCSFHFRYNETLTILNAQAGQVYAVLITNFNGAAGFIKFEQLSTSTGTTDCDILYSVDAGNDKNLCGVSSTTITANADVPATSANPTFSWFKDTLPYTPTILSSTSLSQTIEVSDLGRHVYKVEITVPGGLNTAPIVDETVVVLGPTITAVIPPVYNMCDDVTNDGFAEFDLTTLYSQALGAMLPADYTASVYLTEPLANVGTASIPTPDRFTNTTINTQTVFVRVQSNLVPDCFQVVAAVLKVNPATDPEVDFTLPAQVCITDPNPTAAQATGFAPGGTFSTNNPALVIDPTTGEINLGASAPGTYEVVYTIAADPATCTPLTVTTPAIQIIVNPAGVPVTDFNYVASVCVADTNLVVPAPVDAALFTPGGVYSVDVTSPTPASSMVIDPVTGEITLATTAPGIYIIKYEIAASACGTGGSDLATIEIKALTAPNVTFAYNPVCQNASTSALPSTMPVALNGTFSATGITVNSTTGAVDLTTATAGTYFVRYDVTQDVANCTSADFFEAQIVITTGVTPDSFFEYETSYCRNAGTVSPLATSTFDTGGTFTVTPTTGLVINPTTGYIDVNASNPGSYVVTYLITADALTCRTESKTVKTVVISADFDVTVDNDCVNAAYVLTATPNDPSYTYTWKNAAGTVVGTNSPTFNVTEYVGTSSPVYPLLFTVTVNNGCDVTEPFSVPNIACNIPKGISPNGDGDNDEFDLTGFNVRKLEIFNRYGKKVNSFSNYRKEWRGQADNGNDLPDGTYYYVIEREGVKTVSGWVQINRQRN